MKTVRPAYFCPLCVVFLAVLSISISYEFWLWVILCFFIALYWLVGGESGEVVGVIRGWRGGVCFVSGLLPSTPPPIIFWIFRSCFFASYIRILNFLYIYTHIYICRALYIYMCIQYRPFYTASSTPICPCEWP